MSKILKLKKIRRLKIILSLIIILTNSVRFFSDAVIFLLYVVKIVLKCS